MDRRHRADTIRRKGQPVAVMTSDGIGQIAIDVRDRQRETFGMRDGHAAEALRILRARRATWPADSGKRIVRRPEGSPLHAERR